MEIVIDNTKLFNVTINGEKLSINDIINICEYYEACCTGEYAMENYHIKDDEDAISIGYDVRYRMNRWSEDGQLEREMLDEVTSERHIKSCNEEEDEDDEVNE